MPLRIPRNRDWALNFARLLFGKAAFPTVTIIASLIWIHSFLRPTITIILFQPNFSSRAITDLDIFDEGGRVRANVKYVWGISDNFVSEHFYKDQ